MKASNSCKIQVKEVITQYSVEPVEPVEIGKMSDLIVNGKTVNGQTG
jgi:hypothetical protein